jgi:hypothetical protein
MALMEIELRSGALETAREILAQLSTIDDHAHAKSSSSRTLAPASPRGVRLHRHRRDAELAPASTWTPRRSCKEFRDAGCRARSTRCLKLVEICVDGGLEATMYEAQAQLADAYLEAGQGAEARVIAEDLVAREPWEHAHIERFRRALVMLGVPTPTRSSPTG